MDAKEHDARVRALADRMPDELTRKTILAVGYRADFCSGDITGFSVETIAKMTNRRRKQDRISTAHLKRGITAAIALGVVEKFRTPTVSGKRQPNAYRLDYDPVTGQTVASHGYFDNSGRTKEQRRALQQA